MSMNTQDSDPNKQFEEATEEAERDLATLRAQIESDILTIRTKMASLEAERASASGEARAKAQARIEATKTEMEAVQARIKAANEAANEQMDAKISSLQQQAAHATGEAKAEIEEHIAQAQYENEEYVRSLNTALADNRIVL
jgi:chromosome segregation ATPase